MREQAGPAEERVFREAQQVELAEVREGEVPGPLHPQPNPHQHPHQAQAQAGGAHTLSPDGGLVEEPALALAVELVWALMMSQASGAFSRGAVTSVAAIGRSLYTTYAFPFEVTSLLILVAATALALATCARAQSVADFYRGKQINLAIGTSAGNDYDFRGRLIARHMGKHIPGNPTLVPRADAPAQRQRRAA